MLLCGLVRAALSASVGAVVQILILLLQNSHWSKVQASLPPGAEDEIILIEHLPGRRVHLQDFFWTGAEDAPPWVDPTQGLTFYETRTIHHTVTIYSPDDGRGQTEVGQQPPPRGTAPYDPECKSCIDPTPRLYEDGGNDAEDDRDIGILIGEDPGPRYWLLTVLRAGEAVPSKVELRLARLYRAAFSRQQERHLGLLSTDPRARRAAKSSAFIGARAPSAAPPVVSRQNLSASLESILFEEKKTSNITLPSSSSSSSLPSTTTKPIKVIQMTELKKTYNLQRRHDANSNEEDNNEPDSSSNGSRETFIIKDVLADDEGTLTQGETPLTLLDDSRTTSKDVTLLNEGTTRGLERLYTRVDAVTRTSLKEEIRAVEDDRSSTRTISTTKTTLAEPGEPTRATETMEGGSSAKLRSFDRGLAGVVQVRMQNTSVIEGGATRLIYSVHLGGKPVPAETAARDMALLSPQEVALELGAPVIVQSEPYLKESRPLALSRKRDVWLLIGAASAGIVLLALVFGGLIVAAKRKRAHSAVVAPPSRSILKKEREYVTTTPGLDNIGFSTSETEGKTDGTSQRQTPGTLSRTPVTPDTPDSLRPSIDQLSTDEDEEPKKRGSSLWDVQERPLKKTRTTHGRMTRTNAIDPPKTPDSLDIVEDPSETNFLESLENGYARPEEATASPHSYLSMPSCKQFPSMRSVEPLSRVLEPVMVRHLDIESPELARHDNGHVIGQKGEKLEDKFLARTSSASRDPGVVGPIVWNLRRHGLSNEGNNATSETDLEPCFLGPIGPVGRARRRLHELLEDSFSLFGSRDPTRVRSEPQPTGTRANSVARTPDTIAVFSETRGRSAHVSPVATPTSELKSRPRTSLPRRGIEEDIPETGHSGLAHSRGAWGSRPLSAGPFHRPNLPEVDTMRILMESQLPPEDPAVPLIASIKKELEKFSPQ